MNVIFADTFYLIGILNRGDQYHARCLAIAHRLKDKRIVTTQWILTELADSMAKAKSRHLVLPFIQKLRDYPHVKIIPTSEQLFQRGLRLYDERRDKTWTLTDCISFMVMQDEKITDALTGDQHFTQAGFKAVLA